MMFPTAVPLSLPTAVTATRSLAEPQRAGGRAAWGTRRRVKRQACATFIWLEASPPPKGRKMWWECQTCLQVFTGGMSAGLAEAWWSEIGT